MRLDYSNSTTDKPHEYFAPTGFIPDSLDPPAPAGTSCQGRVGRAGDPYTTPSLAPAKGRQSKSANRRVQNQAPTGAGACPALESPTSCVGMSARVRTLSSRKGPSAGHQDRRGIRRDPTSPPDDAIGQWSAGRT